MINENKITITVPKLAPADGVVFYVDGGSAPTNPGYGGSGVHGYAYSFTPPKKGSGNADVKLTSSGYIANDEVGHEHQIVTPLYYFDSVTSFKHLVTNNATELSAGLSALIRAEESKIPKINIHADSNYFVEGTNKWLSVWKRNFWKNRSGNLLPNIEIWKQIDEVVKRIHENKQELTISHIYGHSGFLGNEIADRLATIGVMWSKQSKVKSLFTVYPPTKYWDKNSIIDEVSGEMIRIEKHPFLNMPRLVFSTFPETQVEGRYLLASAIKDDDLSLIGAVDPDKCLSVVILDQPEPIVEKFIKHQTKFSFDIPSIIVARLDYLLKPSNYVDISQYGIDIFAQSHPLQLDLISIDKQPVSRELRPPRKAQWEMDELTNLYKKLISFKEKDKSLIVTDITAVIYDSVTEAKTKQTKLKIKDEFVVGFSHFDTSISFSSVDGIESADCRFSLGIDIPERNTLKRLETMNPKVYAVTWTEEGHTPDMLKSYRVATIIEVQGGIGIWAGVYSNLRIVKI